MILPRFELVEPTTVEEVCDILQKRENVKVIAGGTDLLVNMKRKVIVADTVVSISKIPGLNELSFSDEAGLMIGSMVRIAEINVSPVINTHYPGLATAAGPRRSHPLPDRR